MLLVPGLALATLAAAVALALERTVLPKGLSAVTIALALGLLAGNTTRVPAATAPGLDFAARRLLPVAIVLVGLRVSLGDVADVGPDALALAALAVAAGLVAALGLGRLLGVGSRLAALIAVGTAICGNTAIVASAPILRARRSEVAYAVATITAFGTLAIVVFPLLGHMTGMADRAFGLWAGAGVHDTSQVVATGFSYSDAAGETATIVKLARNAFLGPVLIGIALLVGRDPSTPAGRLVRLPWFVWAFAGAVALASLGVVPDGLVRWATEAAHALILAGIAAIGATTDLRAMRAAGPRPFALGLVAMAAVSALALTVIGVFGLG